MPPLLVVERDAGRRAEAETARVLGDRVDAEPLPDLVEEDVARLDDRLVQVRPQPWPPFFQQRK